MVLAGAVKLTDGDEVAESNGDGLAVSDAVMVTLGLDGTETLGLGVGVTEVLILADAELLALGVTVLIVLTYTAAWYVANGDGDGDGGSMGGVDGPRLAVGSDCWPR